MCIGPQVRNPFVGHPLVDIASAELVLVECPQCHQEFTAFTGNPVTHQGSLLCPHCRRRMCYSGPWIRKIVALITTTEMVFADHDTFEAYEIKNEDGSCPEPAIEIVVLVCPRCGNKFRYVGMNPQNRYGSVSCPKCHTFSVMYSNWVVGGNTIALLGTACMYYVFPASKVDFRVSSLRPAEATTPPAE